MSRSRQVAIVTRESEVAGVPDLKINVANTPFRVYLSLEKAGPKGITCRDWHGYDLRHHLRVLRNKGVGIDRTWEKHEGGQHGRWRLRAGHSHRIIDDPKMTKAAGDQTIRLSSSNANSKNAEILNGLS